jgi:acyl dehydratase
MPMSRTTDKLAAHTRLGRSAELARHAVFFYRKSLQGLFREHRLRLPRDPVRLRERFSMTAAQQQNWHEVYGLSEIDGQIPFSYFWPVAVRAFFHALSTLGVNYRRILHLKGERSFRAGAALRPELPYRIESHLSDILRLRKRRVALLLDTAIAEERAPEQPVMKLRDWILVKRLPRFDVERVALDPRFNREGVDDLQALSQIKPRFVDPSASHRREGLAIPGDVGMRYGIVSGDLNFIHTFRGLARLFGYPDKFVQGGYTANYLLKVFVHDFGEQLEQLAVRFCRPIFAGQTVELRYDATEFEIVDWKGAVLASGERRVRGAGDRANEAVRVS